MVVQQAQYSPKAELRDENPSRLLIEQIKSSGYTPGDSVGGRDLTHFTDKGVSVLREREPWYTLRIGSLEIPIFRRPAEHLGTVYHSAHHKIKEDGKWYFEVCGRNNLDEMTQLANFMADRFGVNIDLEVASEEVRLEWRVE